MKKGFSLLEILVAISILFWMGAYLGEIMTRNAMRIAEGSRSDEMYSLIDDLLQEAIDEDYDSSEEETQWEPFQGDEGEQIHEDYVWRYIRREYEGFKDLEGSDDDDQLRDKAGFVGPYMEYRVEVRQYFEDEYDDASSPIFALWRIVPPPWPGDSPEKVPTGTPGG